MKISELEIHNYKCHKEIKNLPFHDLTTIIGENDSGKSSIIDFLEIMLTTKTPMENDFFQEVVETNGTSETTKATEIAGIITFLLNNDEKIQYLEYCIEDRLMVKKIFNAAGSKTFLFINSFVDIRFLNYKNMNAGDLKQFLLDLNIEDKSNQELRKEAIAEYIETGLAERIPEWTEYDFKDLKQILPKFVRYGVEDYKNPNSMIKKVLDEVFQNEIYEKNQNGIKVYKSEQLKVLMDDVKTRIQESALQFKTHISRYNSKITDITVAPDIDLGSGLREAPIKIKDETGIFHDIESRGFGTKKRLYLAIFDWSKEVASSLTDENIIRCYDEPDNNLHIEAQRGLYKTIKSIVSESNCNCQALICTHSLFMVDTVSANTINLLSRKSTGETEVNYLKAFGDSDIQNFIETMCREMGLSNSHIFFEKCFILVEGQSEINFLPSVYKKCFGSTMAEDGISLINLDGNGSAINFMKLLMRNKKDMTLLFLDSDSVHVNKEKLKNTQNIVLENMSIEEYNLFVDNFFETQVILIGEKEFEDSFANDVYVDLFNKKKPKNDLTPWLFEEIETLRSETKFSDSMCKLVWDKCAPISLKKPELGVLLALEIEVECIPQKVIDLFVKARLISKIE